MASKRNKRRRSCIGKRRFASQIDAFNALRNLNRHLSRRDKMTPYRCKFCTGFHFGHTPARVRQSMAAKR